MKEKIIGIIIIVIMLVLCTCAIVIKVTGNDSPQNTATISEDYIPSETTLSIEETSIPDTIKTLSAEESYESIVVETQASTTSQIEPTTPERTIESIPQIQSTTPISPVAIAPEVEEDQPIIEETLPEIEEIQPEIKTTPPESAEIADAWVIRAIEYPIATEIWLYMKSLGWNDEVCAGIMGNIMAECGGQTLSIQWWAYGGNRSFYGICQWHSGYFPAVQGQNLQFQLDYLRDTIEDQFDDFGSSALTNFLNLTNCREAALVFAKRYERCSSASYTIRQQNAQVAYEYFVG